MGKKKKLKKEITITKFRLSKIDLLFIGGLLALVLIYFFKAATLQGVFITGDLTTSDLTNLNYPVRHFLGECLKKGIPPLWTPDIYGGFPVFAESEMGGFYPPNLLLFATLPPYIAFNYSIILNFFLTALFFYLYVRSLNLSSFPAFIGGFAFAFCGFFVTHLKHTNMIYASCWLPLLFFLVEMFFKKGNFLYPVLGGLTFGVQMLAGHSQMAYYSILATSIYLVFRFGSMAFSTKGKIDLKRHTLKFLAGLMIIYTIGAGLSAVQVIPTKEFTDLASRAGGMNFTDASAWPYHPKNLITFIFPYWFGDYAKAEYPGTIEGEMVLFWENCGYVGIFTLILALLGLIFFFLKRGEVRFFAILGLFSLLLVFGKYTPLYEFLWNYLPGLKFFRFPNRFLLLVDFCLCLLSAFGIQWILSYRPRWSKWLTTIITIAVIFDLFNFGFNHNPTVKPAVWLSKPKTVEFLEKDNTPLTPLMRGSLYRIFNFACDESWRMVYSKSCGWKGDLSLYVNHREVLHPNFNLIYHIPSIEGYPAFAPRRLNDIHYFFRDLNNVSLYKHRQDDPLGFAVPKPQFTKLLGILNVKYILSFWEMNSPMLKEVWQVPFKDMIPARVYENAEVVPRVYVVPKAKVIEEGNILGELTRPEFNPEEYVVMEEKIDFSGSDSTEGSDVQITKYSPLEVIIEANLSNDGFLVFGDTYYPGWKAFVDGKLTKIYRANYIQRTLPIKEGRHKIRFVYAPLSFKLGAIISLLTLLLVLIYFVYQRLTNCSRI